MNRTDALALAELLDERRHLLDVACWMLGSSSESESVLDETYREWYDLSDVARREIGTPRSWLSKVAGAICLGRLARPRPAGPAAAPAGEAGASRVTAAGRCDPLEQQVSQVLLSALDSFSPAERAAFLFNDVHGTASATAADAVGTKSRPKFGELGEVAGSHPQAQWPSHPSTLEHDAVVRAVRLACVTENADLLSSVLAADATAFFDGGGKVRALIRPVYGSDQVGFSLLTLLGRRARVTLAAQSVNGRTGLVARYDRRVAAVITLDTTDGRVTRIWVTLNPDKLRSWNNPPRRL